MTLKVLHAPLNFAQQPMLIVEELKRLGVDAHQLQYLPESGKHRFNFKVDKAYVMEVAKSRNSVQMQALKDCLDYNYDIYHFWQRSLIYKVDCGELTGIDLPFIKSRGARIIHRFTGFDLRLPSWDVAVNPYSPFKEGYKAPFKERVQREYIDYLKEYVDQFLVQDPELLQFMPEAKVLPRCLDLSEWQFKGVEQTDCPVIVHAPTDMVCKGSGYVFKAIDQLKEEGLKFEFIKIENMSHDEAKTLYEKSDIIIDQLLIGATGVLTLEGMALGKPVVVNIREDLFKGFYDDLPFANANPDTIKNVLRKLIKDYEWRKDLSERGRRLIEKYHDSKVVGKKCLQVYEDVLKTPEQRPSNSKDVVFLTNRVTESFDNPVYSTSSFVRTLMKGILIKYLPNKWLYKLKGMYRKLLALKAKVFRKSL